MYNRDLKKDYKARQTRELKAFNKSIKEQLTAFDKQSSSETKKFDDEIKERLAKQNILYTDAEVRGAVVANKKPEINEDDGWE